MRFKATWFVAVMMSMLVGAAWAKQGQNTPPSTNQAEDTPSLEATMKFIQDKLNGAGPVDYVASYHNNATGTGGSNRWREETSQVAADSNACRIDYHGKVTINGEEQSGNAAFSLLLKTVDTITVQTKEQYFDEIDANGGDASTVVRVNPPVFVLVVKRTGNYNARFDFSDERLANRVAKAMTHAVQLCSAGDAKDSQLPSGVTAEGTSDVVAILEQAKHKRVELSAEDKQKLRHADYNYKDILKKCNDNNFYDRSHNWDTGLVCFNVASDLEPTVTGKSSLPLLGVQNAAVELAFQRACAFPSQGYLLHSPCAALGDLYVLRGDYATALAVYLHAPNCDETFARQEPGEACLQEAWKLSNKMKDRSSELAVVKGLCTRFSNPSACLTLNNSFGGSVDIEAAKQRHDASWHAVRERAKEEIDAREEALREEHRESDARFSAVMGALESMPGGSDPNAIANAGNQQAASIRAVGDANAAQQQLAAQQRAAARQAAAQQAQQNQPVASQNASSVAASSPASDSGENSSAHAVHYVAPLPATCVRQFWDAQVYNWLAFENDCGQAIDLTFIFNHPVGWAMTGSMNLAPGAHDNTGRSRSDINQAGGFKFYVCPAGTVPVDLNGNTFSTNVADFHCKQQ